MSMGFKEWAVVCEALGDGRQTVLLRKGGIAEGREGFRFQHPEFYLLPTWFHEQAAKTRLSADTPMPDPTPGIHRIRWKARVTWTAFVDRWEAARALEPFHILSEGVVRARFEQDDRQGLHLALVRVEQLDRTWDFPDDPRYGGCRSWVDLPEPPLDLGSDPVLDDARFAAIERELRVVTEGG